MENRPQCSPLPRDVTTRRRHTPRLLCSKHNRCQCWLYAFGTERHPRQRLEQSLRVFGISSLCPPFSELTTQLAELLCGLRAQELGRRSAEKNPRVQLTQTKNLITKSVRSTSTTVFGTDQSQRRSSQQAGALRRRCITHRLRTPGLLLDCSSNSHSQSRTSFGTGRHQGPRPEQLLRAFRISSLLPPFSEMTTQLAELLCGLPAQELVPRSLRNPLDLKPSPSRILFMKPVLTESDRSTEL